MTIINHNKRLPIATICVIAFILAIYLFITSLNPTAIRTKTVLDLQKKLCLRKYRPRSRWTSICPKKGIITVTQAGKLANQLFEYAAVWAISKKTGLTPYIPGCIRDRLDQAFQQLPVRTFDEILGCPINISIFLNSLDDWYNVNDTKYSLILPKWTTEELIVSTFASEIRTHFVYKKNLVESAQKIFQSLFKDDSENVTFVGMHIKRNDYINFLALTFRSKPARVRFYKTAMKYFEEKYENVQFIVTSNDYPWCQRHFRNKTNVYIVDKNTSPELDLTILSYCNHSIFDYGTFGTWSALYAGGETIYFNSTINELPANISLVLKKWRTFP